MTEISIRFTLDAGNVDFYEYEVGNSTLIFMRDNELQENQTVAPNFIVKGDLWKQLNIAFIENRSTTRAKIEQLISEQNEMLCYYAYLGYGTSKSLNCIFLPH